MPNWYRNEKLKKKVKDIARPALMMAPLGLGLGLLNNGPQKAPAAPPISMAPAVQSVPATKPSTQPTSKPATQPATQPTTKPTTQPSTQPSGGTSDIVNMLKEHEGYSEVMYPDTKGIPTIGIGFNLQRGDAKAKIEALGYDYQAVLDGKQKISKESVLRLFNDDVADAKKNIAGVITNFAEQPQVVQDVMTDMMFNMGPGTFGDFHNMIAAVIAKDYSKAADEMENSKWYGQVGNRGPALVKLMRSAASSASPATQPTK